MAKLIKCKACGAEIYKGVKRCPQCGKKNKKPIGIIVIGIIVLLAILSVALGSGGDSKKSNSGRDENVELRWPTSELASLLPKADFKYGEVTYEREDYISLDVYKVSKNDYNDYVDACKQAGFTVDYSSTSTSYNASDANGNKLSLYYDETEEFISIMLNAFEEDIETEIEIETETETETDADDAETEDVDFRKWVDDYEDWMNKYVDFMKDYDSSDTSSLLEYTELMTKYAELMEETENLKEEDYSVADWKYYTDAQLRITKRLSEIQ